METSFATARRMAGGCALAAALLLLAACGKMTPEEMLNQGRVMLQNHDIYGAEMQFQKIIAQYPESEAALPARLNLIYCFSASQDIESALQQADKVIEIAGGPQTPEGFQMIEMKIGLYNQRKEFQKALDLALASSDTLKTAPLGMRSELAMNIGLLYLDNKQRDKAKALAADLMEMVADHPELHPQALNLLSKAYDQKEDEAKLLEVFQTYLKRFPESPIKEDITYASISQMKRIGKDDAWKAAFDDLRTFVTATIAKQTGDLKAAHELRLAQMEMGLGEKASARTLLESIVAENPTGPAAVQGAMGLASLDLADGNRQAAINRLQKAVQENPQLQDSQDAMGLLQAISQAPPTTATLTSAAPTSGTMTNSAPTSGSMAGSSPTSSTAVQPAKSGMNAAAPTTATASGAKTP